MNVIDILRKNLNNVEWFENIEKMGFSMDTEISKDLTILEFVLRNSNSAEMVEAKVNYLYEKMIDFADNDDINNKNARKYFDMILRLTKHHAERGNTLFFDKLENNIIYNNYAKNKENDYFFVLIMFSGFGGLEEDKDKEKRKNIDSRIDLYKRFIVEMVIYHGDISKLEKNSSSLSKLDIKRFNDYFLKHNGNNGFKFIERLTSSYSTQPEIINKINKCNILNIKPTTKMLNTLLETSVARKNKDMVEAVFNLSLKNNTIIDSVYVDLVRISDDEKIRNCFIDYEKKLLFKFTEKNEENQNLLKKQRL